MIHLDHGPRDEEIRGALAAGRTRMTAATVAKMRLYGCAGRAAATA